MFSNERDSPYPKRENGYPRAPYDDREWFRRSEFPPREREYSDDYRYRQKRDWPESVPSPKRRKLGSREELDSPSSFSKAPVDYKRPYSRSFRSSRSPSPSSNYKQPTHLFVGGKERYPMDYYDREPYKPSYRDRESEYGPRPNFYRDPHYSRGGRSSWDQGRGPSKYDYKQYDNGFRRDYEDYRRGYDREGYDRDPDPYEQYDRRPFEKDSYERREYSRDKYSRNSEDLSRDFDRDLREHTKEEFYYDREKERDRERTLVNVEYYSPTRASDSESEGERDSRERDRRERRSRSKSPTPPPPVETPPSPEKPQPKKRLGWGQGLVAFEKKTVPDEPEDNEKLEEVPKEESSSMIESPTEPSKESLMENGPSHASSSDPRNFRDIAGDGRNSRDLPTSEAGSLRESSADVRISGDVRNSTREMYGDVRFSRSRESGDARNTQENSFFPQDPRLNGKDPRIPFQDSRSQDSRVILEDSRSQDFRTQDPRAPSQGSRMSSQDVRRSIKQEKEEIKEEESMDKMEEEKPAPIKGPSKEEILGSIEKIDAEITKTEMLIANLKKPKKIEHKHHRGIQTTIEEIYEDNRERVTSVEEDLSAFIPSYLKSRKGPLYKRPADLPSFVETIQNHESIRERMAKIISKRQQAAKECEKRLREEYISIRERWKKRVQKLEGKRKKKTNQRDMELPHTESDHVRRPLLRTQEMGSSTRGGRFSLGDAARSEAELDMIISQLKEEDDRDMDSKYVRTIAKIPPMLLKGHRPPDYVNKNGLVEDPMAAERERKMLNPWTDAEKALFLKKFMQYPKAFPKIASYFENKTNEEVVWYYYTNKRTLNLKKLLIEQQSKRRGYARKIYVQPPPPPPPVNPNLPREVQNLGVSPYWSLDNMRSSRGGRVNYNESALEQEKSKPNSPILDTETKWNDQERDMFIEALGQHAKDFKAIANQIGTKNQFQCKNFYHNSKKKYGLDKIVEAANKKKKLKEGEKKPSSADSRRVANSWTDEDRSEFLQCFTQYGKNWKRIADSMSGKTMNQIKYYYQISRTKLNLDKLLEGREDEFEEDGRKRRRGSTSTTPTMEKKKKGKKAKVDSDSSAAPSPVLESPKPQRDEAASALMQFASTLLATSEPPKHISSSFQSHSNSNSNTGFDSENEEMKDERGEADVTGEAPSEEQKEDEKEDVDMTDVKEESTQLNETTSSPVDQSQARLEDRSANIPQQVQENVLLTRVELTTEESMVDPEGEELTPVPPVDSQPPSNSSSGEPASPKEDSNAPESPEISIENSEPELSVASPPTESVDHQTIEEVTETVSEVPQVPDAPQIPEVPEIPEVSQAAEVLEEEPAPEVTETAPEDPQVSEVSEVSEIPATDPEITETASPPPSTEAIEEKSLIAEEVSEEVLIETTQMEAPEIAQEGSVESSRGSTEEGSQEISVDIVEEVSLPPASPSALPSVSETVPSVTLPTTALPPSSELPPSETPSSVVPSSVSMELENGPPPPSSPPSTSSPLTVPPPAITPTVPPPPVPSEVPSLPPSSPSDSLSSLLPKPDEASPMEIERSSSPLEDNETNHSSIPEEFPNDAKD